jgi:predicted nucleic acid-binding protein
MFEIKRGLRAPERKSVLPLLDALIRLSADETIWDAAGDLDARLRGKGITIPPMDIIIAQICLDHKVPLFCTDKHFSLVPGLKLFKP